MEIIILPDAPLTLVSALIVENDGSECLIVNAGAVGELLKAGVN